MEFMKELMQYLKDQKKLHKKYAFKVNVRRLDSLLCYLWRGGGQEEMLLCSLSDNLGSLEVF